MPQYQLQIPKPCNEDWSTMTPAEKGKFCNSCTKKVIDFTNTSNIELARLIHNDNNICGRFKQSQLNKKLFIPQSNSLQKIGYLFGIASFLGITNPIFSQTNKPQIEKTERLQQKTSNQINHSKDSIITIKGIVSDESGLLPGTSVLIKNTKIGVETNFDGEFSFSISKKEIEKSFNIIVSFVGMKSKSIIINKYNYSDVFKVKLINDNIMGEVVITEIKKPNLFKRIGKLFSKKEQNCKTSTPKK